MIRLTSKVTRPNTKMTFYPRPSNLTPLVEQAKQDGKLITEDFLISRNKLTFTYVSLWASKDALDEFNQQEAIKDFHKRRKWFEQEFEQIRTVTEDVLENTDLYLRVE
jgi:quinol monooxygenase YgiN